MYVHIIYSVYVEQRNHHPDSKTRDQGPVLRKRHKETNQNRQVGKQRDRQNSCKWGEKLLAYVFNCSEYS